MAVDDGKRVVGHQCSRDTDRVDPNVTDIGVVKNVANGACEATMFVPAFEALWGLQDDVSHHRRRYTADDLRSVFRRAGLTVHRLSYFNTALFVPIAAARWAMRLVRPPVDTENDLTSPLINRVLGRLFGAEAVLLSRFNLPVGVSLLAVAGR